jgi:predicted DNA-binding transcriptional regulator YafY
MRADRLISLILLLQRYGRMTCAGLARELEVSRRTILRDIDALSYSGIPIVAEGGRGGGVRLRDEYRTSLTGMKDEELRALLLSRDGALLGDLGWGEAYRQGQLKLDASLPVRARSAAEFANRRLLIDSRWWWHQEQPEETISLLQEAAFADRVIEFQYERHDGRAAPARVEAYALVAKSGLWYLVAKRDGETRCYRASRMSAVAVTGDRFARDPDFDVRAWWPLHSREFAREFSAYRFVVEVNKNELKVIRSMAPGRALVLREGDPAEVEVGVESEWYAALIVLGIQGRCSIKEPAGLARYVLERAERTIAALSGNLG